MQRALTWLNLYGCEAVQHKLKNSLKTPKMHFFACSRAYVGQPHDHIGWVTSMPFASINPTNPRTNLWNFHKILVRIGGFENLSFFASTILNFFLIFFFFASFPLKSVQIYMVERMGRNFYVSPETTLEVKNNHTHAMRNITLYSVVIFIKKGFKICFIFCTYFALSLCIH